VKSFLVSPLVVETHRKSTSWHTALRLRKKSEKKDKDGKREGKLENGYRKSREGLSNKVSVKLLNPNYIYDVPPEFVIPLSEVTCETGETVVLRCRVLAAPRPRSPGRALNTTP